ncbi:dihydrodipicolinate synthase family protein [Paenirhodobacter populi]|uniref:dihydrodipicolinate synthase family protein n=1 Tax=Paenirhodobacter populi TaxID=2306993 RepID=UPI000FE34D07|nr:dihydrodipicolinate synthase family protein [Sinirhodobacter populi]RWR05344.1 dihydrodipicolinate synthase family protein [Sinirhodobacter populi]
MTTQQKPYRGLFPVAPTVFHEDGSLDLEGQRRVMDCMIDQGVDGICILANYSEQFLVTDEERRVLTETCLEQVAGRVPVMVTCSHFSTDIAVSRAKHAAGHGAALLMLMPPYHGTGMRIGDTEIFEHFERVSEAGLPVMIQDAPLSSTAMPVPLLVEIARRLPLVRYFKIEVPGTAAKLRALIAEGGDVIEGPFDGEEGITLMADLDAGATGTMVSAMIPDLVKPVLEHHFAGRRSEALAAYARILPVINYENRQCGLRAAKAVMRAGGVIRSDRVRHPLTPLHPETRKGLLELAADLNPLALSWGK